ncbi:hypothetical protein SLA2020_164800 [Shorea laevis]
MEEDFDQNGGTKSCENEDSRAYRRDFVRYGKSTVSSLFKSRYISVVDADVFACVCFVPSSPDFSAAESSITLLLEIVLQDVLKKGTVGYRKVVAAFGRDILQDNGEVDRPKLGQIVFSDASKRQLLDRMLAPYISFGIFLEILKLWLKGFKIIVLDIPLLSEAKMEKQTNPIIVVWVDPETQLQRLLSRDGTAKED